MAKEETKKFDPNEIERKAEVYEKMSKEDSSSTWKKYHEGKAKQLRRLLTTLERLGWYKKTTKGWEKRSVNTDRR